MEHFSILNDITQKTHIIASETEANTLLRCYEKRLIESEWTRAKEGEFEREGVCLVSNFVQNGWEFCAYSASW